MKSKLIKIGYCSDVLNETICIDSFLNIGSFVFPKAGDFIRRSPDVPGAAISSTLVCVDWCVSILS